LGLTVAFVDLKYLCDWRSHL